MYGSDSASHSGLKKQQPQRYSDRHREYSRVPVERQQHGPDAAQHQGADDIVRQAAEVGDDGKPDDHQGIRSYLKKTDPAKTHDEKSGKVPDDLALEWSEKESSSQSEAPGR